MGGTTWEGTLMRRSLSTRPIDGTSGCARSSASLARLGLVLALVFMYSMRVRTYGLSLWACKLMTERKAYASVSLPSTLTVEPSRGCARMRSVRFERSSKGASTSNSCCSSVLMPWKSMSGRGSNHSNSTSSSSKSCILSAVDLDSLTFAYLITTAIIFHIYWVIVRAVSH